MDNNNRTISGAAAISTHKTIVTAPGRPGKLARMLEQLGWRCETRITVDGQDRGLAIDNYEILMSDRRGEGSIISTIIGATICGYEMPLTNRSSRLTELGAGRWKIGSRIYDIIQPEGQARREWET